MTEEQKIICKQFLNDADKTHSCNEYKLLMALLEQESVLDKIRAKINTMPCVTTLNGEIYVNRDEVNNIIDKYKAETEADNGNNNH